jgi:hypothetical protein
LFSTLPVHWVGPGVIHLPLVPLTGRSDHFANKLTAWSAQRKGVGIDTDQARICPVRADTLVVNRYHEHVQIVLGIGTAKRIERIQGLAGIGAHRVDGAREQCLRLRGRCSSNVMADHGAGRCVGGGRLRKRTHPPDRNDRSRRRAPGDLEHGAIASSDAPGALELFRKIMIASTSIPGQISPVMIDVDIAGKHFQEMHVDGGVITQVFLYPPRNLMEMQRATGRPYRRELHVYVIRNGRLDPDWYATERHTLSIGDRAIRALIQTQGISDLQRIYQTAQHDGADFNLAYIGSDFNHPHKGKFDGEYMKQLFDYAYQLSVKGYPWHKAPPGEATLDRD